MSDQIDKLIEELSRSQRSQMLDLPCPGMGAGLFAALYTRGLVDIHDDAPEDEFVRATALGEAVRERLSKPSMGEAYLLKIGCGQPETFATIAGLRLTAVMIDGERRALVAPDTDDDVFTAIHIEGKGIFTGSMAEKDMKGRCWESVHRRYELSFESGARMRGEFVCAQIDFIGDFNGERTYLVALESSTALERVS